jgi:predicted CXXCH cytochrome family protein
MNTDELASGEAVTEEQLSSLVIHYPYEVRACDICHDPNSLGKMVEPEPGLCYICHDDYKNRYPWLHGPVAGGYCTSCHDPHTSKQAKLLKFTGHALCYFCHREEDVLKSELHTDLGEMACTDCHNPHGGEDHLILY